MLLRDKVAIVTGGAQGIGRAVVNRLAAEGAKVVVVDIKEEACKAVVKAVEAKGREAVFKSANIAERLDVLNLVAVASDAFGQLDILVNNAAIADEVDFLDLDVAEFDRVMNTNLKGPFLLSQAVAKRFVERLQSDPNAEPGNIINISSVNAAYGLAGHVAYALSKGGLAQLTRSMALALAPHGIRVNAVAPGAIDEGGLADKVLGGVREKEQVLSRTPLGRFGTPDEVANVVAWLASKEASYLTGTTVWADGGRMALSTLMPDEPEATDKDE